MQQIIIGNETFNIVQTTHDEEKNECTALLNTLNFQPAILPEENGRYLGQKNGVSENVGRNLEVIGGLIWKDRKGAPSIRETMKVYYVESTIKNKEWSWAGYIMR